MISRTREVMCRSNTYPSCIHEPWMSKVRPSLVLLVILYCDLSNTAKNLFCIKTFSNMLLEGDQENGAFILKIVMDHCWNGIDINWMETAQMEDHEHVWSMKHYPILICSESNPGYWCCFVFLCTTIWGMSGARWPVVSRFFSPAAFFNCTKKIWNQSQKSRHWGKRYARYISVGYFLQYAFFTCRVWEWKKASWPCMWLR